MVEAPRDGLRYGRQLSQAPLCNLLQRDQPIARLPRTSMRRDPVTLPESAAGRRAR